MCGVCRLGRGVRVFGGGPAVCPPPPPPYGAGNAKAAAQATPGGRQGSRGGPPRPLRAPAPDPKEPAHTERGVWEGKGALGPAPPVIGGIPPALRPATTTRAPTRSARRGAPVVCVTGCPPPPFPRVGPGKGLAKGRTVGGLPTPCVQTATAAHVASPAAVRHYPARPLRQPAVGAPQPQSHEHVHRDPRRQGRLFVAVDVRSSKREIG